MDSPQHDNLSSVAVEIVHAVYSHRFLTLPQISTLFQRDPRTTELILSRLVKAGYLAGVKRPVLDSETSDTVYALDQRGANLVATRLGLDRGRVRWRKYHNYVGLPYVEHRLAVNDVRIAFTVSAGRLGYTIEGWWYEFLIKEDIDDPDEKAPPLVLRPDAYARLLVGPRRLHLFLEVDMGTESHTRFAAKIRRYLAYKESGMFRFRDGGRAFRVLVVAPTLTRAGALRRVTEADGGKRMFWFASQEDIATERIAAPVWEMATVMGAKVGLFDRSENVGAG
jgi:hypothetical protein